MDKQKRKTLKRVTAMAAVTVAGTTLAGVAHSGLAKQTLDIRFDSEGASLAELQVYTRISADNNDIEVVIRNTGDSTANITAMTPSQTATARGVFDFARLFDDGPVTLSSGKSVVVPMIPHTACVSTNPSCVMNARSLTQALRVSLSVITDYNSFAKVDVQNGLRYT